MNSNTSTAAAPRLPVSDMFLIGTDEKTFNDAVKAVDQQFKPGSNVWKQTMNAYYRAMRQACPQFNNWIDNTSPETQKVWHMTCRSGAKGRLRRDDGACLNCEAFNMDWHPQSTKLSPAHNLVNISLSK